MKLESQQNIRLFLNSKRPVISLLFISFLSALLWRIEVKIHGWEGLIWITYFHFSIPIGVALFMIWANFRITFLTVKARFLANVLAILFIIITFSLIKQSLYFNYVGGPAALVLMTYPNWLIILLLFLYLVILPLLPVGIYFILKLIAVHVQPSYLLYSVCGILLSIPASIYLCQFIFPYQKNLIHAIKTGLITPFIMFSTGILLLGKISSKKKESVSADILDENLQ